MDAWPGIGSAGIGGQACASRPSGLLATGAWVGLQPCVQAGDDTWLSSIGPNSTRWMSKLGEEIFDLAKGNTSLAVE